MAPPYGLRADRALLGAVVDVVLGVIVPDWFDPLLIAAGDRADIVTKSRDQYDWK